MEQKIKKKNTFRRKNLIIIKKKKELESKQAKQLKLTF